MRARRAARSCCWLLTAALLRAIAPPSAAAEQPPLSLAQVVRAARERPAAVRAALVGLLRARAEVDQVAATYLPRLSAEASSGVAYSNGPVVPEIPRVVSTSLQTRAGLALEWAVLELARGERLEQARAAARGQAAVLEAQQADAMRVAAQLFMRALAAARLVEAARLTIERRNDQQRTIAELVAAGMRPAVDAQRARLEIIQAEQSLQVELARERALASALATAIGADPVRGVRPQSFDDALLEAPAPAEVVARRALARRPELRVRRERVAEASAAHRAALRERLPTLGLAASGNFTHLHQLAEDQFSISGAQYDATAGVYVRWSGLDPSTWALAGVTERAVGEADWQLRAEQERLRDEAVQAFHGADSAAAQEQLANQLLAAAQVTRDAQAERYGAGAASLLELLDAEDQEQRARQQQIEAQRELRLQRLELMSATGTLGALGR